MDDQGRLDEARLAVEVAGKLADDPAAFEEALSAFEARDAERFQSVLARVGLLDHCRLICHWFCSKHCVFVCRKLAGTVEDADRLDHQEVLAFTLAVRGIAADAAVLAELVAAIDAVDERAFRALMGRLQLDRRYWHQLCHWFCHVRCRVVCRELCPFLPEITKVGMIPADQISPVGFGAGPSQPPGFTPPDQFSPGPYGHHPFGGLTHIEGNVFGIANAQAYKVEWATNPAGPWVTMNDPVWDFQAGSSFWRYPDAAGWFAINQFGQFTTSLANWSTPPPDGLYWLRLTVRNTLAVEFHSGLVPALVDNTPPSNFSFVIEQAGEKLPCCGEVAKERGPLTITVIGEDANFEALSVALRGGCNVSYPVFSKSYDGNTADTGAPAPGVTFTYDPWAAGVQPCCYVLEVVVSDRAIVNNTLWAHHVVSAVHSITIL
jgi:hypothetical protein